MGLWGLGFFRETHGEMSAVVVDGCLCPSHTSCPGIPAPPLESLPPLPVESDLGLLGDYFYVRWGLISVSVGPRPRVYLQGKLTSNIQKSLTKLNLPDLSHFSQIITCA